jgi:hypothetical protein
MRIRTRLENWMKTISITRELSFIKMAALSDMVELEISYDGPPDQHNYVVHEVLAHLVPGFKPIDVTSIVAYTPGAMTTVIRDIREETGNPPQDGVDNVSEIGEFAYQLGAAQLGIKT